MENDGSLTMEAAARALRPFKLDFGTHLIHGQPCVVSVEISNVTDLPVQWELYRCVGRGMGGSVTVPRLKYLQACSAVLPLLRHLTSQGRIWISVTHMFSPS
jgi:hypothetical protein